MKTQIVRSVRNISWLMTMDDVGIDSVGLIENAAIVVESGQVEWDL